LKTRLISRWLCQAALTTMITLTGAASAYAQSADTPLNVKLGRKIVTAYGCEQCHSLDGTILKPGIPNLAGQKAAFLARTLMHMKLGTIYARDGDLLIDRDHTIMTHVLSEITPWQIKQIAAFFEHQTCTDSAKEHEPLPPPRGVNHCETCHGSDTRGNSWQDTPYLAGQDQRYLEKQIHQLWETRRHEHAGPKRYHRLAEVMFFDGHEPYLDAYADYYASLSCSLRHTGDD
jgi:cytochrome c553